MKDVTKERERKTLVEYFNTGRSLNASTKLQIFLMTPFTPAKRYAWTIKNANTCIVFLGVEWRVAPLD